VRQPNGATPISWPLLLGLALATLGLHVLSSGPLAYGYMSDELYYLDSTARLAWGYVDHPPLSIAILKLVRAVLGDSLPALRLLPALARGSSAADGPPRVSPASPRRYARFTWASRASTR